MLKRILAILLAVMLLLSFTSCKGENDTSNDSSADDTSRSDESQTESNASEEVSKDEAKTVETKYFGTLREITYSDGRKGCLFKAEEWGTIDAQSIDKEYIEDFVADLETAVSGYDFITVDLGEGASMTAEYPSDPLESIDHSSLVDMGLSISPSTDTFCKSNVVTPFGSYKLTTKILTEQYQSIKTESNEVTFGKYKKAESDDETLVYGYVEYLRLLYGIKPDEQKVALSSIIVSSQSGEGNSFNRKTTNINVAPETVEFIIMVIGSN